MDNTRHTRSDSTMAKKSDADIWKPHVTVAAVVEQNNRFLMVEEPIEGQIIFNQPAGHLEDNETLTQAIIREVREETAWGFTPESILGFYQWKNPDNGHTYMRTTFTGSVYDHNPDQPLFDDIIRASWKSLDELQSGSVKLRSPLVLTCINDYLAGIKYPIEILCPNETIV